MTVPEKQDPEATPESRRRLWQESVERTGLSEEGRKWREENAEAIRMRIRATSLSRATATMPKT